MFDDPSCSMTSAEELVRSPSNHTCEGPEIRLLFVREPLALGLRPAREALGHDVRVVPPRDGRPEERLVDRLPVVEADLLKHLAKHPEVHRVRVGERPCRRTRGRMMCRASEQHQDHQ